MIRCDMGARPTHSFSMQLVPSTHTQRPLTPTQGSQDVSRRLLLLHNTAPPVFPSAGRGQRGVAARLERPDCMRCRRGAYSSCDRELAGVDGSRRAGWLWCGGAGSVARTGAGGTERRAGLLLVENICERA